ncbi:MAG TPA: efflux RND transporter periplasmic adaptor subunit [Devosiaceae bacterium]|jgi:macrolide-specific efflux system membrane fusion protein
MKSLLRIGIVLAVVVVAGGAAWWMFSSPKAAPEPTTVEVTRGNVEQTVLASGALQAKSVTSVGAEVSGRIETLHVKLGDNVQKGDLIAEIDSLNQENAVKAAEASLANIKAQKQAKLADVTQTQQALDRAKQLSGQKLVSQADLEAAQALLDSANAQIASLDAQISQANLAVDSANLNLSRTKIIAPASGTVVAVLVTEGQTVNANQTTPTLVKIADLDTMIIKAQISEADVTRVAPGQKAYFTILGEPDQQIDATLLSLEPAPDAITTADSGIASDDSAVYYNGLFQVDNPDHRLRIAMTAKVTIVLRSAQNALTIPSSALGTPGKNGAYMLRVLDAETGEVTPRKVTVGLNNNIVAEITDGLKEGDRVVTGSRGPRPATANANARPGGPRIGSPRVMGL